MNSPEELRIEVSEEDIRLAAGGPFCCPIAQAVRRAGGTHGGICRAMCVINGTSYQPAADAIAFMNAFDTKATWFLVEPTVVTFVRPTPKAAVRTYL